MKILNLVQGSDEWLEARAKYDTASEAPAMMGVSPYMNRNDLLTAKHTGVRKEVDAATQRVFDKGHESEAAIRPVVEAEIGEDLFPCMVVDGDLSASLDGFTIDRSVTWEHKQTNKEKIAHMKKTGTVPECDIYQVQQGLMITGADKCLYTCGNTPEELERVWVNPDPEAFKAIKSGWAQFRADLTDFKPTETAPEPVANTMERLPALNIQVTGAVSASNLSEYKSHALEVFNGINTDLQSDQDFADAESTVKWCKEVESKLESAKESALSQTADIDELFRTIDDLKESARQKRLELDKLVKSRKQAVRGEILQRAETKLAEHIGTLNNRLGGRVILPRYDADFAGAIKGKRTIQSLNDAVDQVLASAKIETNSAADEIQVNLTAFDEIAADHKTLFPHLIELVMKPHDDFVAAIKVRIAEHKEAEQKRIDQERERIREEEQKKAQREAQAAEQVRQDAERAEQQPEPKPEPSMDVRPAPQPKQAEQPAPRPERNSGRLFAPFDKWWSETGSGITPNHGDDMEAHAYKVSRAAFEAGVEAAIDRAA